MEPLVWRRSVTTALVLFGLSVPHPALAEGFPFNSVQTVGESDFLPNQSAAKLIGHRSVSPEGATVGEVVDVIHDDDLVIRGYVVDVGGVLGIGATPIYFPADRADVRIDGESTTLVVDMMAAEVRAIADAQ